MEPTTPQPTSTPPNVSPQPGLSMPVDTSGTEPPQKPKVSNKMFIIAILVGIVAIVVIVAVVAHKPATKSTKQATTGVNEAGYNQSEDELNNFKQTADINVSASGATPQTLTVPVDTKIIWKNSDSVSHEIAISPGENIPYQFYNNRTIIADGGYPFVIRQTGTFHYYYVDNPSYTGTVVVK